MWVHCPRPTLTLARKETSCATLRMLFLGLWLRACMARTGLLRCRLPVILFRLRPREPNSCIAAA